jgi:hypothetical protein
MPNWCDNYATLIHVDSKQIDRVEIAALAGSLMTEFFPCPPSLLNDRTATPNSLPAWYSWRLDNWGCKWDISREDITSSKESPSTIALNFLSAWAPPLAFYSGLEKLGFKICAYYNEPGMGFCGKFEEGQNARFDTLYDPDWLAANIPSDILEEMNILSDYS